MASSNLSPVPVSPGKIGNIECLTVDARMLHKTLGVRRDFSSWLKARIAKYGFIEDQDYQKIFNNSSSPNLGKVSTNGLRAIEYTLTIDMGKELCMVENNDQGKLTRRYFIECERKLYQLSVTPSRHALQDSHKNLLAVISQIKDCSLATLKATHALHDITKQDAVLIASLSRQEQHLLSALNQAVQQMASNIDNNCGVIGLIVMPYLEASMGGAA